MEVYQPRNKRGFSSYQSKVFCPSNPDNPDSADGPDNPDNPDIGIRKVVLATNIGI